MGKEGPKTSKQIISGNFSKKVDLQNDSPTVSLLLVPLCVSIDQDGYWYLTTSVCNRTKLTFNMKPHIFCGVYMAPTCNKERTAGVVSAIIAVNSVELNRMASNHRNGSLSVFGMRALTDGENFLCAIKPGRLIPYSSFDQTVTGKGNIFTFPCCDGQ